VLDATVAAAVTADEDGFEHVLIAEHHFMSPSARPRSPWPAICSGPLAASRWAGQRPHGPAPDRPRRTGAPDQVSGGRSASASVAGRIDLQVLGTGHDRDDSGLPETRPAARWLWRAGTRGWPVVPFPGVTMVPPRSRPRPEWSSPPPPAPSSWPPGAGCRCCSACADDDEKPRGPPLHRGGRR
jgi:hypothetical protein